jgi:hypothetical protein
MQRAGSAGWAFLIVAGSLTAAYGFEAAGLQWLARVALVPVYPVLRAVVGVAGGFHSAAGESRWMIIIDVISLFVWWAIIAGWRRWAIEGLGSAHHTTG